MKNKNYESDDKTFPSKAYKVNQYGSGIAWRVYGWEIQPVTRIGCTGCDYFAIEMENGGGKIIEHHSPNCPDDSELFYDYESEEYERTGNIICVMVGDDRQFSFDSEDVTPLNDGDYCSECGQIGCKACG